MSKAKDLALQLAEERENAIQDAMTGPTLGDYVRAYQKAQQQLKELTEAAEKAHDAYIAARLQIGPIQAFDAQMDDLRILINKQQKGKQ